MVKVVICLGRTRGDSYFLCKNVCGKVYRNRVNMGWTGGRNMFFLGRARSGCCFLCAKTGAANCNKIDPVWGGQVVTRMFL